MKYSYSCSFLIPSKQMFSRARIIAFSIFLILLSKIPYACMLFRASEATTVHKVESRVKLS